MPSKNALKEYGAGGFYHLYNRGVNNGEIELITYCLMPNHFHLMKKQNCEHGIDHFMRSLLTKHVRYFNSQYKRIGPLFQEPYKAVRIKNEYHYLGGES